jgi:hypothetical protein
MFLPDRARPNAAVSDHDEHVPARPSGRRAVAGLGAPSWHRVRGEGGSIGEVTDWQRDSPERLKAMKDHLAHLERPGVEAIED